jgi:endoglucanase
MIRSAALPSSTKIISVETSKALPGVVLGGGPVIRLGDRASMFDHRMVFFMERVARELKKKDRRFRCQRRVMDGGTCEATPYRLNGYVAGGIAIPLHNYHNQGKTKIGAEAVHLRDVEGAVRFLVELALRIEDFATATEDVRARIEGGWEKYGARLKQF